MISCHSLTKEMFTPESLAFLAPPTLNTLVQSMAESRRSEAGSKAEADDEASLKRIVGYGARRVKGSKLATHVHDLADMNREFSAEILRKNRRVIGSSIIAVLLLGPASAFLLLEFASPIAAALATSLLGALAGLTAGAIGARILTKTELRFAERRQELLEPSLTRTGTS